MRKVTKHNIDRRLYEAFNYRRILVNNTANHRAEWQDWEIDYLKSNFKGKESYIGIATYLKRTVIAVEAKKGKLALTLPKEPKPIKQLNITLQNRLYRMQELIKVCEMTNSPFVKEKAKEELRKLSGMYYKNQKKWGFITYP